MNATLIMTPAETLSQNLSQAPESQAVKKVVLLLGYAADLRKKLQQDVKKDRVEVRPPPRWGIND
jgi:hypothetical protein